MFCIILHCIYFLFQIRDLQTQLTNERGSNSSSIQELKESRSRIEALLAKVADLENRYRSQRQYSLVANKTAAMSCYVGVAICKQFLSVNLYI